MASRVLGIFVWIAILLICGAQAGMDQFLRDSVYSIWSQKDDGALSISDTGMKTHKKVTLEKWKNLNTQKWVVNDFQSIGKYEFTPLVHNTSSNMITYQFTKNVYAYKRQWKVHLISTQRYQVQNPESGQCLTSMGLHQQVDETDCDAKLPMNQVWKFRMLPR